MNEQPNVIKPVERLRSADDEMGGHGPPQFAMGAPEEQGPALRDVIDTLVEGRTFIGGAIAVALAMGIAYVMLAVPTYQSEVVFQIEEKPRPPGNMEELAGFDSKSQAESEVEILRSRSLVGTVVDELQLSIRARPRYLPVVGEALVRRGPVTLPAWAPPLLRRYAWGGESIKISRFDVPRALEGKRFTVVARGPGRFDLRSPDGDMLASGAVGESLEATVPLPGNGSQTVSLLVSELRGGDRAEFVVQRLNRLKVVEGLRTRLLVSDKSKKSNVIPLTLEGPDPVQVAATLDGIARVYQRQKLEWRSAEANRTMDFIGAELPKLRAQLDVAERALNEHLSKKGNIDVGLEAKSSLDRLVAIEKEITTVELQASEARQRYTNNHPVMTAIREKLARLRSERNEIDAQLRKLPRSETDSTRVMRELKVTSEMYGLLLNKSQELQLINRGLNGTVRIVDAAFVPQDPISPDPARSIALSLAAGTCLGILGAFARRSLSRHGVEDPEIIEREIGIPVYASIPHSVAQARASGQRVANQGILANIDPADLAVEAIRSLRTSVRFALTEARNNIIMLASPSPGTGKSFVSVNLAYLFAESDMRVLLVDADLRKGRLHRHLGLDRTPGLSDLIRSNVVPASVVRSISSNLSFIAAGEVPANPAELLGSNRYQILISDLSANFDVVLIDTPPVLAVTDAVLAGSSAGTTLLVLRAGEHDMRDIVVTAKRMSQSGVSPHALILNDVMPGAPGDLQSKYSRYDVNQEHDHA